MTVHRRVYKCFKLWMAKNVACFQWVGISCPYANNNVLNWNEAETEVIIFISFMFLWFQYCIKWNSFFTSINNEVLLYFSTNFYTNKCAWYKCLSIMHILCVVKNKNCSVVYIFKKITKTEEHCFIISLMMIF